MSGTVQTMSAGQMRDLATAVVQALPTQLPDSIAQGWIGSKGRLGKIVGDYLTLRSQIADPQYVHEVVVYPSIPMSDMIQRGRYDWVDPGFEQQEFDSFSEYVLPTNVLFTLHCPRRKVYSEDVAAMNDREGGRSINLSTLLAIGAAMPGLQCRHRIVTFGTKAINRQGWWRVPVLDFDARGRTLGLVPVNLQWDWDTHFARKARLSQL